MCQRTLQRRCPEAGAHVDDRGQPGHGLRWDQRYKRRLEREAVLSEQRATQGAAKDDHSQRDKKCLDKRGHDKNQRMSV